MQSAQASLLLLAEAVADGSHVDWDHAESSVDSPDERHIIQQLRQLSRMRSAARAEGLTFGSLEIRGEIGRGTFGTVYRAWDGRLEREVALKTLHVSSKAQTATGSVLEEA